MDKQLETFDGCMEVINKAGYMMGNEVYMGYDNKYFSSIYKKVPYKKLSQVPDFRDGGEAFLFGKDEKICAEVNMDQSTYSCAIPNIGNFFTESKVPNEVLAAFLRVLALRHEHKGYVQAVTLARRKDCWPKWNAAFKLAGWTERARVKSNHGNYFNVVWEWTK